MPRNKQKNVARAVAHQASIREKKQYIGKINRAFAKLSGASLPRVEQALRAPNWREPKEEEFVTRESQQYRKVRNPIGQQINARQKIRGKSIPLI
jgi:hypothetical protein